MTRIGDEHRAVSESGARQIDGSHLVDPKKCGHDAEIRHPTRGRILEALFIGAATQTAIAIVWVLGYSPLLLLVSMFVVGVGAATVFAQRRLLGAARLIWSILGGFWAGVGFWVTSIPLTLRSTPQLQALAYPLFSRRGNWYTASDLLPLVLISVALGVFSGVAGWIIWGMHSTKRLLTEVETPERRAANADKGESWVPSHEVTKACDEIDQDMSRERWGPPGGPSNSPS